MTRTIYTVTLYVPAMACFIASLFEPWGKPGAILLVSAGVIFLVAAIVMQQNRHLRRKRNEAEDFVQCINVKRHDWMNHVQVMMGYLSLNNPDRLQPYLKQVIAETEQESFICHLGYAPLSRYLLAHNVFNKDIALDVHIVNELTIQDDRQGERLLKTIREVEQFVLETCKSVPKQPLKIGITMTAYENAVILYVELPNQPQQIHELKNADWTDLCRKVSSRNGEVFLQLEEPAMECTVRIS